MKLPTLLVIALAAVRCAESHADFPIYLSRSFRKNTNFTPAGVFNPLSEKCCLGSVLPSKEPAYEKCCGSGMFDSRNEMCCNGAVVPLVPGEDCCGQKTINTDNAICCEGEEARIPSESVPFARCCRKEAYDPRTQTCCYRETGDVVLEGTGDCCGDKTYKYYKELCCTSSLNGTTIYSVLPSDSEENNCCGGRAYNPSKETCCNDKLVAGVGGCCAGKIFDQSTHICCNDRLTETKGRSHYCCGDNIVDIENELCCEDSSVDGTVAYNVVKKTDPKQSSCCGSEPYAYETQICCYDTKKVVTKSREHHYDCCGENSFGPDSGLCCNNVLFSNFTRLTHECCGSRVMDRRMSTCCGDKIVDGSKSCCGNSEVYVPGTQLCCSTFDTNNMKLQFSVVENPGNKLTCCGLKGYDLNKEQCCGQQTSLPKPKGMQTQQCCGTQFYNTQKELCCGAEVIPRTANTQCCGSKPYNLEKEVCCGGTAVFPKENGRGSCCLYGTTDETPEDR